MEKACTKCNKICYKKVNESRLQWSERKYCSRACSDTATKSGSIGNKYRVGLVPWNKGKKPSPETVEKNRLAHLGKKASQETKEKMRQWHRHNLHQPWLGKKGVLSPRYGKKHTEETKEKIRQKKIGGTTSEKHKEMMRARTGEKSPSWIKDRSKLQRYNDDSKDRRSYAYADWRKQVWLRDNFKCKITNPDCLGRIEAHHILRWKDYPELRYQVNNGITLCHAHHPRKVAEENRLIPTFMELISVSN